MSQMAPPQTTSAPPTGLPTDIESTGAKLVYLYLDRAGATTITELATALDMRKLSLYSILDTLAGEGLVDVDGETYALA